MAIRSALPILDSQVVHMHQGLLGKSEATTSLVLEAELQPGFYCMPVWTACAIPPGVVATAELLLKVPFELNLRPVTRNDLLHREG